MLPQEDKHVLLQRELTFYIRYYYFLSFQKYAYRDHMNRYAVLFDKMKTAFPDTVNARVVLHHILDTLLGEAMKQTVDPKEDGNTAAIRSFFLIFSVVKSYVNQDKLGEGA